MGGNLRTLHCCGRLRMATDFHLFGLPHLLILAAVPGTAAVLRYAGRCAPAFLRPARFALGSFLAANELVWYGYRLYHEGFRFPEGLPLQLCDLALWLTVIAALTLKPWVVEVAYFAGVGGSTMALITPDLWAPLASYPSIYFFLSHGFVVITLLTLIWGRLAWLRPGCVWRVFGLLNAYAAAVAIFNAVFKTNYMYLCRKPASASVLDYFGPWPAYVAVGEVLAVAVFWLLWLLARSSAGPAPPRNPVTLHLY